MEKYGQYRDKGTLRSLSICTCRTTTDSLDRLWHRTLLSHRPNRQRGSATAMASLPVLHPYPALDSSMGRLAGRDSVAAGGQFPPQGEPVVCARDSWSVVDRSASGWSTERVRSHHLSRLENLTHADLTSQISRSVLSTKKTALSGHYHRRVLYFSARRTLPRGHL